METKVNFKKNYTRDTNLFLQDIWARDQSMVILKELNAPNPYLPGIIHHVNNGTLEIWENESATQWLMDKILEKNISDPGFLKKHLEIHADLIEKLKKEWSKGALNTKEELKNLADLIEKAITGFNIFYRTAFDDRTPKDLRDVALEVRKNDVFFSQNDTLLDKSIKNIFPEIKGYGNYIFSGEIDNLPSIEVLIERKKNFIVVDGSENFTTSMQDYAQKNPEYKFEFDKVDENLREIKGQIGFKGKVVGKVKLLFRREQIKEVQEGDILVSPMTTPDFLQAMEKASAFVTDEGGITCHAAIVAREMQKPCIIGTKIATQVLKDGDVVEVDADNGVVRIIK